MAIEMVDGFLRLTDYETGDAVYVRKALIVSVQPLGPLNDGHLTRTSIHTDRVNIVVREPADKFMGTTEHDPAEYRINND